MQILPMVDIKEGQAVRFFKGDFNQKTTISPDMLEQAKIFARAGIGFIHVVDLDGTLDGRATNRDLVAKLKQKLGLGVEVGDDIRTLEQIEDYLAVGVDRIIIGSIVVKNPDFVKAALDKFGSDKIVVGTDAKNGFVTAEGRLEMSDVDYIGLAKAMEKMGMTLFVYTDVNRDSTLTGPNFEHYERLMAELTTAKVITSSGIVERDDLVKLQGIGVARATVGKAYYNGNVSLDELKIFGG